MLDGHRVSEISNFGESGTDGTVRDLLEKRTQQEAERPILQQCRTAGQLIGSMSYVGVPTVPRDSTIASSMIVQDYISKRFRGEKPISRRYETNQPCKCISEYFAGTTAEDYL